MEIWVCDKIPGLSNESLHSSFYQGLQGPKENFKDFQGPQEQSNRVIFTSSLQIFTSSFLSFRWNLSQSNQYKTIRTYTMKWYFMFGIISWLNILTFTLFILRMFLQSSMYCFKSLSRYSNTNVRDFSVWTMSWRVTEIIIVSYKIQLT